MKFTFLPGSASKLGSIFHRGSGQGRIGLGLIFSPALAGFEHLIHDRDQFADASNFQLAAGQSTTLEAGREGFDRRIVSHRNGDWRVQSSLQTVTSVAHTANASFPSAVVIQWSHAAQVRDLAPIQLAKFRQNSDQKRARDVRNARHATKDLVLLLEILVCLDQFSGCFFIVNADSYVSLIF